MLCIALSKAQELIDTVEILDTSDNDILPICSIVGKETFTPLREKDIPEWFKTGMSAIFKLLTPQSS
jgi:hypothetical protein